MNRTGKRMNVVKAFCLLALLGCFIGCKDDEKRRSKLLITVCLLKLWASSPGKSLQEHSYLFMEKTSVMILP